jgi:hypothetical protein
VTLTREQLDALLQPIAGARVTKKDNQSHVEAYDIRRRLTNIFGFGGWGETSHTELIYEDMDVTVGKPGNERPGVDVGYKACTTLTVYGIGPQGQDAVFTEEAFGGQRMGVKSRGDCHDFAIKTAESQALKRCATNLGDQFGLSLYNNGSLAPLVVYVLGEDMAKWTPDGVVRAKQGTGKAPEPDHVDEPLAPETPAPGGDDATPPAADSPPAQDQPSLAAGDELPIAEPVQVMLAREVDAIRQWASDADVTSGAVKAKLTKVLMQANQRGVRSEYVPTRDGEARTLEAYIQAAISEVGK